MPTARKTILLLAVLACALPAQAQEVDLGRPRDSVYRMSKARFDSLLVRCAALLRRHKRLSGIGAGDHVAIIRLHNTLWMSAAREQHPGYDEQKAKLFSYWYYKRDYTRKLPELFTDFVIGRGLGFYFPSLGVELDGTPFLRSRFELLPP